MKQMKEDKFKSFLKECNNTSTGVMMSRGNGEASEGVYYCCHYGIFYEDFFISHIEDDYAKNIPPLFFNEDCTFRIPMNFNNKRLVTDVDNNEDYAHVFQDTIMYDLIVLAQEVITCSAIYLHINCQWSSLLEAIIRNKQCRNGTKMKPYMLFNNDIHNIKCFTSKDTMAKDIILDNNDTLVTVLILLSDDNGFRIKLNNGIDPIEFEIMKPNDIFVISADMPITKYSVSHSESNYMLLTFSMYKKMQDFIENENHNEHYKAYFEIAMQKDFYQVINESYPDDCNQFKTDIIEKYRCGTKESIMNPDFVGSSFKSFHEKRVKELSWENIAYDTKHDQHISTLNDSYNTVVQMERASKQIHPYTSDRDTQNKWLQLNKDVIEIGKSSPPPLPLETNIKESDNKSPHGKDKKNQKENRVKALPRRTNVTES